MPILTLLTDFGSADWYVAAVKGVVLARVPQANLVDLGHEVAPGDIEGATFLLRAAAPLYPPGTVHLAVVDPGVGSFRRMVAARAGDRLFVAPDNGLLTPFLALPGVEVRAVERPDLYREARGNTFHGRDRFAPVAAALLLGASLESLGPPLDDPVLLSFPEPSRQGGELRGRIEHIDRYGSLITDLPSEWLAGGGGAVAVIGGVAGEHLLREVNHYAELAAGEPAVLPGSLGTLELALRGENLARRWDVARGATVRLRIEGSPSLDTPGRSKAASSQHWILSRYGKNGLF